MVEMIKLYTNEYSIKKSELGIYITACVECDGTFETEYEFEIQKELLEEQAQLNDGWYAIQGKPEFQINKVDDNILKNIRLNKEKRKLLTEQRVFLENLNRIEKRLDEIEEEML